MHHISNPHPSLHPLSVHLQRPITYHLLIILYSSGRLQEALYTASPPNAPPALLVYSPLTPFHLSSAIISPTLSPAPPLCSSLPIYSLNYSSCWLTCNSCTHNQSVHFHSGQRHFRPGRPTPTIPGNLHSNPVGPPVQSERLGVQRGQFQRIRGQ